MNDPHVDKLYYRVIYGKDVDYDRAEAVQETTPHFTMRVEGRSAVFKMSTHFATVDEARRQVVDPYIEAWKILAGIQNGPGHLDLVFDRSDIFDRSPPPNSERVVIGKICMSGHGGFDIHRHLISHHAFPERPRGFVASPDAECMYVRYKAYTEGRESLTAIAYFCLTVLEASAGSREQAAQRYAISVNILRTLGRLSSERGGPLKARKAHGVSKPLLPAEERWIKEVIRRLIKRAGECPPDAECSPLPQITMKDLPPLPTGDSQDPS